MAEFTIFWVRHAVSYANLIKHQHQGLCGRLIECFCCLRSRYAPNARLLPLGHQQAHLAHQTTIRHLVQEYPVLKVGSSCLQRTIETAKELFPTKQIYILPFISEKRRLLFADEDNAYHPSDLTRIKHVNVDSFFEGFEGKEKPNGVRFYQDIRPLLQETFPQTKTWVIVSHSNFLKEYVLPPGSKPWNTSIWKETIDAQGKRLQVVEYQPCKEGVRTFPTTCARQQLHL